MNLIHRLGFFLGAMFLVSSLLHAQQGLHIREAHGQSANERLGTALAAGDYSIPADGVLDIVACSGISGDIVRVYDATSTQSFMTILETWGANLGSAPRAESDDLDLDGFPDLVVGGVISTGVQFVFGTHGNRSTRAIQPWGTFGVDGNFGRAMGNITGDISPDLLILRGGAFAEMKVYDFSTDTFPFSHFATDGIGLGDADGDGYDEWATINAGQVLYWSGGDPVPAFPRWQTIPTNGSLRCLTGIEDLNGDGWAEVAVADPGYSSDSGVVILLSGIDGAELGRYEGSSGNRLGASKEALDAGDLDGDGKEEILVGCREADPNGRNNAGMVVILEYDPVAGSLVLTSQIDGDSAGIEFGQSVQYLGDVNGNGRADYAVGAPATDPFGAADAGSVYVFEGSGVSSPYLWGEPATVSAGGTVTLHMRGVRPGDHCLWLVAGRLGSGNLFGEPLELASPYYLVDITTVPPLGATSIQFDLPSQAPSTVHFESLLVRSGGGIFGPKETTNPWSLTVQ